jgi:son of sevenless-like protein
MSSATTGSRTPSSAGSSDWRVCYVLCQHDFKSTDRDHLSFRQKEILEIVKKEESGWWAALRDNRIGWIPSAFVVEITEEAAESLMSANEDVRSYQHDSERLYDSVSVRVAQHSASVDSTSISTPVSAFEDERDWLPVDESGGKVCLAQYEGFH